MTDANESQSALAPEPPVEKGGWRAVALFGACYVVVLLAQIGVAWLVHAKVIRIQGKLSLLAGGLGMVVSLLTVWLAIRLVVALLKAGMSWKWQLALAVLAMVLGLPLNPELLVTLGTDYHVTAALALARPVVRAMFGRPLLLLPMFIMGNLLIVLLGTMIGGLVSRMVREKNILLPMAVVAALVDFYGVYRGPVAHLTKHAPRVADHFSAQLPVIPGAIPVQLRAIGVGDFIFLAIFLGAIYRLGMEERRTIWALMAAMALVPFAFLLSNYLPGLLFIGAAVVIANWRHFQLTREERMALLWVGVIVIALLGILLAIWHFK